MKKLFVLATLLASTQAFAAGAPAEKAKPNALLDAAFKDSVGNWTCTGVWLMPPEQGGNLTITSKAKITKALDGHQYLGEFSSPKVGAMPAMNSRAEWHYDPVSKMLVMNMVCDNGDASRGTSNGLQGTTMIWTGEGTMMGQPNKVRSTHTIKSSGEFAMAHEMEVNGNWVKAGEETCKKGK